MDIKYLTVDHVRDLHDDAIATFGGASGLRSAQLLASAVLQPQQSAFGEDAYGTIAEKAAAYAFFLTQGHAFVDGNKRTGALALLVFLDVNGYEFRQTDDEMAQMFEDLASGVVEQGEFFGWVCNYTRRKNVIALPPAVNK